MVLEQQEQMEREKKEIMLSFDAEIRKMNEKHQKTLAKLREDNARK